jgi:hypothetical protein
MNPRFVPPDRIDDLRQMTTLELLTLVFLDPLCQLPVGELLIIHDLAAERLEANPSDEQANLLIESVDARF